ncbi:MAG: phosphoribosylaminoimidazolesuccinocarboxamide synthase [Pseudomonadota bacterium]|nr:phosphoribosylaminoimidazolesuccinocarboxamide synthase [Pseudomonadota bacterium]
MTKTVDVKKGDLLYAGKAKSIYKTDNPDYTIMAFRDDVSAFNGVKLEQLQRKGQINNFFNGFIMQKLEEAGIPTHFVGFTSETESCVKKLDMLPLESVIRNRAAGSIAKRYGLKEGLEFNPPTVEFFFKSDELNDPMLNESITLTLGYATQDQLDQMKDLSLRVNTVLSEIFDKAGILLVDFKLEFGLFNGQIVLGDEFSPDGSRLWDKETLEKLDKDRFRQDLGGVVEAYEDVANRIGVPDYFA